MKVYSLDQLFMKTKKDPTLSKRRNDERDLLYDIFHWNVLNRKNKLRFNISILCFHVYLPTDLDFNNE